MQMNICLREKNLHCLRACLRTPTRTAKYQVNSLRSCIRSSLEYMRLVIEKKTMLIWWSNVGHIEDVPIVGGHIITPWGTSHTSKDDHPGTWWTKLSQRVDIAEYLCWILNGIHQCVHHLSHGQNWIRSINESRVWISITRNGSVLLKVGKLLRVISVCC